jgi:membrane protease YdiL (CAAX protease family)
VTGADPLPEATTPLEPTPDASAENSTRVYRRLMPGTLHPEVIAVAYALALLMVELVTIFLNPVLGLAGHALLIFALYVGASLVWERPIFRLLVALVLPSVVRLLSFALLLIPLPLPLALAVIGLPLLAAAYSGQRVLGFARPLVGLTLRAMPVQVLIAGSGVTFGGLYYAVARPAALMIGDTAPLLAAAALIVVSGLIEEFIFRGLLQRAAVNVLRWPGQVFAAGIYALLYLSAGPLPVLIALLTGLIYSWLARQTRSVLGVGLSRGIANACALLLFPLLYP